MQIAWTKHLKTQEEKDAFEKYLRGSRQIFDRLSQILDEEEQSLVSAELDSRSFDNPNWEYKQAYNLGDKARIHKFRKLITLDPKDNR